MPGALPILVLPAAVAAAAWRLRALTPRGAVAATAVGAAVLGGAGWPGGAVLALFFVTGSTIGRVLAPAGRELDAKGEQRDAWQVLANGGAAALGAMAGLGAPSLSLWIVAASLAAATADTWATACGRLSRQPPRHLLTGAVVPRGTSGGVSWAGSLGALAGAALIGQAAAWLAGDPPLAVPATLIGFAGMLLDSAAGAVVQGRFHCPACDEPSEWRRHRCGRTTLRTGGVAWLTNDGVNALATVAAALLGALAWRVCH